MEEFLTPVGVCLSILCVSYSFRTSSVFIPNQTAHPYPKLDRTSWFMKAVCIQYLPHVLKSVQGLNEVMCKEVLAVTATSSLHPYPYFIKVLIR